MTAIAVVGYLVIGVFFGGVAFEGAKNSEDAHVNTIPAMMAVYGVVLWPLFALALLWGAGIQFVRDRS